MENNLYRFVKASERLPDLYKSVPAVQNNLCGQLTRSDERFVQFSWFGGVNSYTIKSENLGSIYWAEPVSEDNQQELWERLAAELVEMGITEHIRQSSIAYLKTKYHLIPKQVK